MSERRWTDRRCYGCGFPRPEKPPVACDNCGREWAADPTDEEFWNRVLEDAHWLFYGDLDEHFTDFVKRVFAHSFSAFGFRDVPMTPDFAVAYWLFLSELVSLDLAEYGTSPRGAWLTDSGRRFQRIFEEKLAQGTLDWSPSYE